MGNPVSMAEDVAALTSGPEAGNGIDKKVMVVTDYQARAIIGERGDRIKLLRRENQSTVELVHMTNVLATRLTIIGNVARVLGKIQEIMVTTNIPPLEGLPHPPGSIAISHEMEK